jgi:hypothetical protein
VLRLEQQCVATEPAADRFNPVVIYNPADGEPQRPANAPPNAVWIAIPDNGRDRPEVLEDDVEVIETAGDAKSLLAEPTAEDPPPWRDESF